jgi:hypothetical protein
MENPWEARNDIIHNLFIDEVIKAPDSPVRDRDEHQEYLDDIEAIIRELAQ